MKVHAVVASFVLLALIATADSSLDSNEDYADGIASFFHGFPRVDFKAHSAPKKFDADDDSYLQGLAVIAMPFMCLAVLLAVLIPIFLCCRFCAGTRGSEPIGSLGYTQTQVNSARIGLVILSIVILVASGLGIAATHYFQHAVEDTLDEVHSTSHYLYNMSKFTLDLMAHVSQTNNDLSQLKKDSKSTMDDTAGSGDSDYKHYLLGHDIFIYTAYGTSIVAALAAILGAARKIRNLNILIIVFSFIGLFLLWIAAGVNLSTAVALSDLCKYPLDEYSIDQVGESSRKYMTWFIKCDTDKENPFEENINQEEDFIAEQMAENNGTAVDYGLKIVAALTLLSDCNVTKDNFDSVNTATCDKAINCIFIMELTEFLMGIATAALLFVAVIALKRFSLAHQYTTLQSPAGMEFQEPNLFDTKMF